MSVDLQCLYRINRPNLSSFNTTSAMSLQWFRLSRRECLLRSRPGETIRFREDWKECDSEGEREIERENSREGLPVRGTLNNDTSKSSSRRYCHCFRSGKYITVAWIRTNMSFTFEAECIYNWRIIVGEVGNPMFVRMYTIPAKPVIVRVMCWIITWKCQHDNRPSISRRGFKHDDK